MTCPKPDQTYESSSREPCLTHTRRTASSASTCPFDGEVGAGQADMHRSVVLLGRGGPGDKESNHVDSADQRTVSCRSIVLEELKMFALCMLARLPVRAPRRVVTKLPQRTCTVAANRDSNQCLRQPSRSDRPNCDNEKHSNLRALKHTRRMCSSSAKPSSLWWPENFCFDCRMFTALPVGRRRCRGICCCLLILLLKILDDGKGEIYPE